MQLHRVFRALRQCISVCVLTQSVPPHPVWWGLHPSYLEQQPPYPPHHVPQLSSAGHRTCSSLCSGKDKSDSNYTHAHTFSWCNNRLDLKHVLRICCLTVLFNESSSDATYQGNRGLLRFWGRSFKSSFLLEGKDAEIMRQRVLKTHVINIHTLDRK